MKPASAVPHQFRSRWLNRPRLSAYLGSVLAVAITTGLAFVAHRLLPHANLSLLFLTGVLIVSARFGLYPGLLASVLSFLTFNFLYTPPFYTLKVDDDGDVATLVFFLLMATLTGNLAARMRREMEAHRASLRRISKLFEFGRHMSSATQPEQVLDALADHLARHLDCAAVVCAQEPGGDIRLRAHSGGPPPMSEHQIASAGATINDTVADGKLVLELATGTGKVGVAVLGIDQKRPESMDVSLARSLCDQAAIALERTLLEADLEQARIAAESEQLRSALLSSLSHDLRTPLASVIGSTSSLLEYFESFSDDARRELLQTSLSEARRLDRYIQNLLDMTRLGHGKVRLERDWVELHDIVSSALGRLEDKVKVDLQVQIPEEIPPIWVHGALIEQALFNLLDNAIRFSPAGGRVWLTAETEQDQLRLEICDQGAGIPASDRERVFDMFFTAQQRDRADSTGTGLGLAICRGMIAAHGGEVSAHEGPAGAGTCMRVVLPMHQGKKVGSAS